MMTRGDWLKKRQLREDARKKKEGNEQEPQILSSAIYQNETSNSLSYDQEIMSKDPRAIEWEK